MSKNTSVCITIGIVANQPIFIKTMNASTYFQMKLVLNGENTLKGNDGTFFVRTLFEYMHQLGLLFVASKCGCHHVVMAATDAFKIKFIAITEFLKG